MEDLEVDTEVIDTRRDPVIHLNSRVVIFANGPGGMFFWMMGLVCAFFLGLDADMVVGGKGTMRLDRIYKR